MSTTCIYAKLSISISVYLNIEKKLTPEEVVVKLTVKPLTTRNCGVDSATFRDW